MASMYLRSEIVLVNDDITTTIELHVYSCYIVDYVVNSAFILFYFIPLQMKSSFNFIPCYRYPDSKSWRQLSLALSQKSHQAHYYRIGYIG